MRETALIETRRSLRRYLIGGVVLVLVFLVAGVGWGLTAELSGAVIAEGQLVVESNTKTIQSPNNGVVAEILVDDGDHVRAGDLLVRLDDTEPRASLDIVQRQMDVLTAQQARMEAETDGADDVEFPAELASRLSDPIVARTMSGEQALFGARAAARQATKDQYRQQIDQLNVEIDGLRAQQTGKQQQGELNDKQLEKLQRLWDQHLTTFGNLNQAARDKAQLAADLGELNSSIAEAKGKIAEIELKVVEVDEDMRSEDGKDLADVRSNLAQLDEKMIAAREELNRAEIRAPQDGTVQQLAFHTVRGVVAAGQSIMMLVPNSDLLTVEAKVRPQDIDQLFVGQQASLRFTAFNQRSTPEINGDVTRISADVVQDSRTGVAYYLVRVGLTNDEVSKLGGMKLVPGMPVEAFITTASRTAMSYLARPFIDQANRAFREK